MMFFSDQLSNGCQANEAGPTDDDYFHITFLFLYLRIYNFRISKVIPIIMPYDLALLEEESSD